jgi:hypothetical protein
MSAVPSMDKETWFHTGASKKVQYALAAITVVAWLAFWGYYFTSQAWTDAWGFMGSPQRIALEYAYGIGTWGPFGLFFIYSWAKHPAWLSPPGKYTKGIKAKVWSPYILTSSAMFAAVFAVAGFGEFVRADLQYTTTGALGSYFGSLPAFLGLWIGQTIARLWFIPWVAGGGAGFITIAAWVTMDACTGAFMGWLAYTLYHGHQERPKWLRILSIMPIMELMHMGAWGPRYFVVAPLSAAWATFVLDLSSYWSFSWVFGLTGLLIGTQLYDLQRKRLTR